MKNLLLNCLLIVILLVSCSSPSDSPNESPSDSPNESPSDSPNESPSESPLSEESKIIGTPTKIGKLEVAQNDFPKKMRWNKANASCEGLGNGWRLPTKDEQKLMYENMDIINGLVNWVNESYWSSTRHDSHFQTPIMWTMDFSSGTDNNTSRITKLHLVRAVRSL